MNKIYPKTGRAYRIVSALDEFYKCRSVSEAEQHFDSLYSWMRRCRLKPMKDAAETISRHKYRIINYFRNRLRNAICEGINSMIQAAKRKARGYHTFEGFANMIYIVAGKLDIESPFPMLSKNRFSTIFGGEPSFFNLGDLMIVKTSLHSNVTVVYYNRRIHQI